MRILLQIFFKGPFVKITLLVAFILNAATWVLLTLFLPREEFIPLAFNIHVGISWSGFWWYAFLLPIVGLVILIGNTFIAASVFLKEKLSYYFLMLTAAAVQFFLLAASLSIIELNR